MDESNVDPGSCTIPVSSLAGLRAIYLGAIQARQPTMTTLLVRIVSCATKLREDNNLPNDCSALEEGYSSPASKLHDIRLDLIYYSHMVVHFLRVPLLLWL